jgi:ubiquinone/menaquinone biosynthesis C-methylase UbiE
MVGSRMSNPASVSQYVLGTAETEHERLLRQAALLARHTERLFPEAGLGPRQRVLDIGSGMGDVALLAAQVVGPEGQIVGIDRDGTALAKARQRAEACGIRNVTFVETDLAQFRAENPFDAIVGRLVLQFVPQPIETLRALAYVLQAGGVMIFQESNWEALIGACEPPVAMAL